MKFQRTKLNDNGSAEYRMDGSTATMRTSRKMFQGGDPPMELDVNLPEGPVKFSPPTRKTEAQKAAEKEERAKKKAAEKEERAKAKKKEEMPSADGDPSM